MRLRSLEIKDEVGMLEWMRDPTLNCFFRFDAENISSESVRDFIKLSLSDTSNRHFAITDENDNYLGTISLKSINFINKTAEYSISLRKSAIGKGVANWATLEVLRIAFKEYELNKIYLNVLSSNTRAIRFYEKIGFISEGELFEHIIINGEKQNLKLFRILRSEYEVIKKS